MPVADRRRERIALPVLDRSGRNDVGVAGEDEERRAAAARGPQIGHPFSVQILEREAELREAIADDFAAARVIRRQRFARDELARERENWRGCVHGRRFYRELRWWTHSKASIDRLAVLRSGTAPLDCTGLKPFVSLSSRPNKT